MRLMVFPQISWGYSEKIGSGTIFASIFPTMASMNMKEPKPDNGRHVLVVEDDQDFRRYVTDCIEAEGIPFITATSVSEALLALKRDKVSLLLVDWFLDRVATEVVRTARSISAVMPIIVMSGKPYNAKMDALLADADEFLEKTVGGTALANRVKRWMGRLEAVPDVFLPQRGEDILPLDEVKCRYIRHAVQLVGNNISVAAQKLGVHRQTISVAMATEQVEEAIADSSAEPTKPSTTRGGNETNDRT
jgi:DNA-binding response OmpR family regulator